MDNHKEQVKLAYNAIAETFSQTRDKPWYEMAYFKQLVKEGSILDLGCGNGRIFDIFLDNPKIDYTGIDFSFKMIELARRRYKSLSRKGPAPKFIEADITSYGLQAKSYSAILMIASYHHILDKKERLELLKKIKNALKDKGIVVITVWNLWNRKTIKKVLQSWWRKIIKKESGGIFDICYPFNNFGKIAYRPYKMFTSWGIRAELKRYFKIFKEERWKKSQNLVFYLKK